MQASSLTVSTNGTFISHLAALAQEGTMFIMYWSGVDKAALIFLFQASLFIFFTLTVVSFFFHLALVLSYPLDLIFSLLSWQLAPLMASLS